MPQSFITSTSASAQTFTVPADYNDGSSTIEIIAPGGDGAAGTAGTAGNGGGGGAGGGYAKRGQTVALGLIAGETIYYTQQAANSNVDSWFNPTNLFLQSAAFASGWTVSDVTLTTGITDPFGGSNAANVIPDAVNTFHLITQTPSTAAAFSTVTYSVYAKANGYNFLELQMTDNPGTGGVLAWFNLSTGVISTAAAFIAGNTTYGGTPQAGISAAGGGWYRCWISGTQGGDPPVKCSILPCQVNGANTFAGDTTSNVTVYGPQINMRNNVPGAFASTTTAVTYAALAKAGPAGSTTTGGVAPTTGGIGDTVRNGGNGGASGVTRGGGGGGGAAGKTGNGANGGAAGALFGGGGGGGSNNGTVGGTSTTTSGANGGNGGGGTGGGTGSGSGTGGAATANSGGGGGGGFRSAVVGATSNGGAAAGDQSFDATHGASGGGGGGGGNSATTGAPVTNGGAGANYGAGGGGAGYIRNAGTQVGGVSVQGVMLLTYTDIIMGQVVM